MFGSLKLLSYFFLFLLIISLEPVVMASALLSGGLGFGMLYLGYVLAKYQMIDWAKGSPYECGFDPVGQAWNPVPMRYFHMVLLFLLWEAETLLLIPLMKLGWLQGICWEGTLCFIIILFLGLLYEWSEGTLSWLS